MAGRRQLPDLMSEALGRISLGSSDKRANVVRIPTESAIDRKTLTKMLTNLRLEGMARAFELQNEESDLSWLSFEERLKMLLEKEMEWRERRRRELRLKKANLRLDAKMEDIDYSQTRGLDKSLSLTLASCNWVREADNVIITGPTGVGKTYLACAFTRKACLEGYSTLYKRLPNLLRELAMARWDGTYAKVMGAYAKLDLLTIDDLGLDSLNHKQRLDLLELLECRHGSKSTLISAREPIHDWVEVIGESNLTEAIVDRVIHNSYRITLNGQSMRRKYSPFNRQMMVGEKAQ